MATKQRKPKTPARDRVPSYRIPANIHSMLAVAKQQGDTITTNDDGQFSSPMLTHQYVSAFHNLNSLIGGAAA